ncbi:hypothetical protein GH733_010063 [Mirounga leonina]|nr:hypothetical protein GH733_010063 [Mirounga leonina]
MSGGTGEDERVEDYVTALETLLTYGPLYTFPTELMYQNLKMLTDPISAQDTDTLSIHYLTLPHDPEALTEIKSLEKSITEELRTLEGCDVSIKQLRDEELERFQERGTIVAEGMNCMKRTFVSCTPLIRQQEG